MQNTCHFTFQKISLLLSLIFLIGSGEIALAKNTPAEQNREIEIQKKKDQILIKAGERLRAQEALEKAAPKTEEPPNPLLKEVPQPLQEHDLGSAEKVRLETLEQQYASGKITETEYKLQKDSLAREANIKF